MSYLNGNVGYRQELLSNRSVVKPGSYALIEPDGMVKNTIPGFENCSMTILATPLIGASFVDYLLTIEKDGKNHLGFGEEGVEVFFYIFEGEVKVWNEDQAEILHDGGYIYSPAGKKIFFENTGNQPAKAFLYKRRYDRIEGMETYTVVNHVQNIPWVAYEGMEDVLVKDFLPAASDLAFDMNFHILQFKQGTCHGYVETHVQEHGAYIYSGQGMYNLNNDWIPVKTGDYIFMDSYCLQGAYGVGRGEEFAYIYSKDCNRDIKL